MDELSLRLSDGTTIVVPASLNSITTYVVLEQEAWLEKEMAFLACWLRPGMTAIDIGANLGIYSLPMARLVAPDGGVFSYEPASELSRLAGSGSSGTAPSESVQITCLDLEEGARDWRSIDFVKIDAEGEEERILTGGRSFFERHSPLVMFEVKA